jgi:hypothetical protein
MKEVPRSPLNASSEMDRRAEQFERRYLSKSSDLKLYFDECNLTYDSNKSRSENILQSLNRLDPNNPVTFVEIPFEVPEKVSYKLPDNFGLKNCLVIGEGILEFSSFTSGSAQPTVINSEDDMKKMLGLYIRLSQCSGILSRLNEWGIGLLGTSFYLIRH